MKKENKNKGLALSLSIDAARCWLGACPLAIIYFNFNLLNLSELLITEILLRAIAAAANIGLINIPMIG